MNAEEARKLTNKNKKRQNEIKKLIERGEKNIKYACENGRRHASINPGFVRHDGTPTYPEVIEHFKNLGYKTKFVYGTNLFDILW